MNGKPVNGWVTEAMNGFGMTVEVTEQLHHEVTPFQTIDIYQTEKLGKLLLLNGIIQLTEFDEFAYQEMMAHVVLFGCAMPRRVLVIGGGDGGVLREIAKHACVETIDICEIDLAMVEAAKRFLPSLACGYDDPRVTLHIADGSEFIRNYQDYYDAIIVDSTDPGGPGEPLFGAGFYRDMRRALRPGGVIGTQSESPFLLPQVVRQLFDATCANFDHAAYGMFYVPTYPTGNIGICTGGVGVDVRIPKRRPDESMRPKLRYYTTDIHQSCFILPQFALDVLNSKGK